MPDTGVALFRIHGREIAEVEVEIQEGRRRVVLFRWLMATDGESAGAVTLLTAEPSSDVAPIHDRQIVVLDRDHWASWLDLSAPESELLRPLPPGSLAVEQVP